MQYETTYRHDQALYPEALANVGRAFEALRSAFEDCRRAGKSPELDTAVLLLIRHLATVAARGTPDTETLRQRCAHQRREILGRPALAALAGQRLARDHAARRTFHHEVRFALRRLARALGIDPDAVRIWTDLGGAASDGITRLEHESLFIEVVPRGFVAGHEVSFRARRSGVIDGKAHWVPARHLLNPKSLAECIVDALAITTMAPLPRAA